MIRSPGETIRFLGPKQPGVESTKLEGVRYLSLMEIL